MKSKKLMVACKCSLIVSICALITGASFHGLRTHPENAQGYKLGITMGTIMAALAGASFLAFIILMTICKKSEHK